MPLNTKVTRIESNATQETVGFYNGAILLRIVSMVKEASINEDGKKITIQSSGLPSFEFDVFSITDIDGTIYAPLSPSAGEASAKYTERIAAVMTQLYAIFKGCCAADAGGHKIQWQENGTNVGTSGQYTTIDVIGASLTQTGPHEMQFEITGGQAAIQFENEGSNLGTAGTVDEVDFAGQTNKAVRTLNKVTITTPSVGENLVLPSLDPANALSSVIGALSPNEVSWTTTGKQNNLSLTGWNDAWSGSLGTGKATVIKYSGTSYAICSGLVGGSGSRVAIIVNLSNKLVILENESTDSSVANRFRTMDGLACFLMPQETAMFVYYDSRWNMIEKQRWDVFDDFSGWSGATTQASNTFNFNTISTTASGLNSQQLGLISMQPSAAARSLISSFNNGSYAVSGVSTPSLVVARVAMSASISTFGRLAIGFGGMIASAGNFYTASTGVCNGAVWGFATDSGVANAATNFFIYSGIGGAASISSTGLDSGVPIANCVNNYNNFVVFFDAVNNVYDFFYSQNNGVYQYVGQRTAAPTAGSGAMWYEALNASRPTIWIDYVAQKTKIVTTR